MGDGDQVAEARRAARDMDNVMFVPGVSGILPWRDAFFTRVIDPGSSGIAHAEIERVTARNSEGE